MPPEMDNRRGVVQWVMPISNISPASSENINKKNNRSTQSPTSSSDSDGYASSFDRRYDGPDRSNGGNNIVHRAPHCVHENYLSGSSRQQEPASLIDMNTCRTICVIIEQYIKELREHQERINNARMKLVAEVPYRSKDENFIAQNDLSRLKVRSEQTKATETIKQLTSYLRELTFIKNQLESLTNSADEATYNRLSDIRNSIIQGLNDFVLLNNDIDFPILGPDDPNEYDLCIDAQRSRNDIRKMDVLRTSDVDNLNATNSVSDRPQTGGLVQLKKEDSNQSDLAERRGHEIQKLERDTVELRRLFADFYELVKVQSEQIDTIEDNIVIAAQQISEGRHHLTQRPMRGLTVLVPVTGCITGALIGGPIGLFVGGKLGGLTIICASSLLGLLSSLGAQKCIVGGSSKSSNKSARVKCD